MESRSNSRRRRGSKRALASFVSFVVLFALALGQGSSMIAWADDAGTVDPVATGEASDGVSTDGTLPLAEDPAELGAVNRALAARGVVWSYGNLTTDPALSDSGVVVGRQRITRRYQLQSTASGRTAASPPPRSGCRSTCGTATRR